MSDLNPGIRRTVEWLNAHGFRTCDSGDGKTHDHECDRDYPYVVIVVNPPSALVAEADRLFRLLLDQGIPVGQILWEATQPCIQATYDPGNGRSYLDLMGLDDAQLPGECGP